MKICNNCLIEKPLSCFHKARARKDGLKTFCKECTRLKRKSWWSEGRPEQIRAKIKRYTKRNPEKRKARDAVSTAVKSGSLTKQPCFSCGSDKTEAHHPCYAMPLIVSWLCRVHHREVHKSIEVTK